MRSSLRFRRRGSEAADRLAGPSDDATGPANGATGSPAFASMSQNGDAGRLNATHLNVTESRLSTGSRGGDGGAILEVRDLSVAYTTDAGQVMAVDCVDLDLARGEFLGIVGESGCGKSTLLFGVAQLLSPPARIVGGSVKFLGKEIAGLSDKQLRHIRWRDYSVVMQSAMNALNPVKSVAAQMSDACKAHSDMSRAEITERSREVLRLVSIDPVHLDSYPHQLSGGMRQRAMIAMALLFTPDLVIMDEPTSALDVVAQRSLMVQIKELQQRLGFAVIFVTHDMSLISNFSDRLAVMYAGQIAELGSTRQLFAKPLHPYTKGLLEAFPSIKGPKRHLLGIPGQPPDLAKPPPGCRFAPRCGHVMPRCITMAPPFLDVEGDLVRCVLYDRHGLDRDRDGLDRDGLDRDGLDRDGLTRGGPDGEQAHPEGPAE